MWPAQPLLNGYCDETDEDHIWCPDPDGIWLITWDLGTLAYSCV